MTPGGGSVGGDDRIAKIEESLKKLDKTVEILGQILKKVVEKAKPEEISMPAPANITVHLPAEANLYVDNVLCTLTSAKRSFATPKLQAGQKYFYTLRVEMTQNGQNVSRSQQVILQAGQNVQVNFNAASGVFTVKN